MSAHIVTAEAANGNQHEPVGSDRLSELRALRSALLGVERDVEAESLLAYVEDVLAEAIAVRRRRGESTS